MNSSSSSINVLHIFWTIIFKNWCFRVLRISFESVDNFQQKLQNPFIFADNLIWIIIVSLWWLPSLKTSLSSQNNFAPVSSYSKIILKWKTNIISQPFYSTKLLKKVFSSAPEKTWKSKGFYVRIPADLNCEIRICCFARDHHPSAGQNYPCCLGRIKY